MNRILLSFVCCTALISTVNVYSETSSVDNQFQNYVTKQTYGPITTYETLWSVSNKLRPNKNVSVYQTLLAIYKTNPSAFLNGDINKIIINSVIDIPSTAFIAQQRNAEALKLLNIDPKKLSITDDFSIVKPKSGINPIEENKKEQSVNESVTQNSDEFTAENVTTETTTDAKYYLPDISEIQKPISQDEIEDREQGMIYLSDLPSIDKKAEPQEDRSVLAKDNTDPEALPTTNSPESTLIEETSTTDLVKDAKQTAASYEEVLVAVEETALENEQANLVEEDNTGVSIDKETLLAGEETPTAKNVQVDSSTPNETTNLIVQDDLIKAEQTTALNETEVLATELEQEVETVRPFAEEHSFDIADESVQSENVIDTEKGNANTVNPETNAAADLNESLNANDETGNNQTITEEFVKNSETEVTTDSVAQALIEEMEIEQEESNLLLPTPFSETELQHQAKTEKTQSDIDKELALLYAQLNTVTEANKILKQRLQPLSEQITLLSNQLNEDASVQDELQSLVEEYKEKIESYEKSPYNGEGSHNAIFRYITESPIALISAILVPLILLTAIFLFLLRRKNNQDSLPAEEANKSEIAGGEIDDLDDFDILLSELTVLKNDYVEGDANTKDVTAQQAELKEESVVEKAIVLSEIEEYLDPEEEIISSDKSIAESLEDVNDLQETINVQSEALDIKNDQQTEKDHALAITNEQQATNKNVVEEVTQMAEAESSKASEAGGSTVNTDAPLNEAKEAGENKVVIGVPQDKEQENNASSDENKTDQDYIEIDYLLSNNDGSEVSEEEFDLDFGLDEFPDVINATDFDTDADRISAQLDLARAYLEIDEKKNAKAILVKLLDADEDKLVEVHRLLERIG